MTETDLAAVSERNLSWAPQPRQEAALQCDADELLFGGAAGGGKSDYLLSDAMQGAEKYSEDWRGVLFRRSFPELEELLSRARELYNGKATYNQQTRTWTFYNGAKLKFRFISSDADVYLYQGHQYCWIGWDELGQYPTDFAYRYLMSRLRSAAGVPCVVRSTANPGGPGNAWIKIRFIDGFQPNKFHNDEETGNRLIFIPSRLEDNYILCKNDPGYSRRLDALPEAQRRALKFGDWDVFSGQVFSEFRRNRHTITPFTLGPEWTKFCSMDWGYAKPYSVQWWGVHQDGRMLLYREMYGCELNNPNTGLKHGANKVAQDSWALSIGEGVSTMIADPACWSKIDESASIAEKFESIGWTMIKADNSRINGLMKMHELMQTDGEDGKPMLLVFNTCSAFIRTVPALVHDPKKPEDVDTALEDHCLHGDTKVITGKGVYSIRDLVGKTGKVLTEGMKFTDFHSCRMVKKNEPVVKVTFDDGREIICTSDHKFLNTKAAWIEAKNLKGISVCDTITHGINKESLWKLLFCHQRSNSLTESHIICAENISRRKVPGFILLFGSFIKAKYLMVAIFTMLIQTEVITILKIWSAKPKRHIYQVMQKLYLMAHGWNLYTKGRIGGMVARKAENITGKIMKKIAERYSKDAYHVSVNNVENNFKESSGRNSVQTNAKQNIVDKAVLMGINTAHPIVQSVEPYGRSDVYCLTAEGTHSFAVNGGIIVSNSYDSARYACMSEISINPRRVRKPHGMRTNYSEKTYNPLTYGL